MQNITERQKEILHSLVDEHIKFGVPISSDFLKSECCFDFSSAAIRLELAELTKNGFLVKTHFSGGRVPTDNGYRFFVDNLLAKERRKQVKLQKEIWEIFDVYDNLWQMLHYLAENLARLSCSLSLVGLEKMRFFWKEGWQNLARSPEFEDVGYLRSFLGLVDGFEQEIEKVHFNQDEKIKIFIGHESPFKIKEFSLILGQGQIGKKTKQKTIFALLGPKRMDFQRNIYLMESLIDLF